MESEKPPIASIGKELVGVSNGIERSPGEWLGQLFPYILEASRRMSTRAISRWLKENHGLEISQPTLSRALRRPERYWQDFASYIEPFARIVAEGAKVGMEKVLYPDPGAEDCIFEDLVKIPTTGGEAYDEAHQLYHEFVEAALFVKENWFALSPAMRSQCREYFKLEKAG